MGCEATTFGRQEEATPDINIIIGTMAAKKFRPSFFRHFKKIGVVHSLLSL
jgi:hypothetical protein